MSAVAVTDPKDFNVALIMEQTRAMHRGHFVISNGVGPHSDSYVEKDRILCHPKHARNLGMALANKIYEEGMRDYAVVVGPACAGIIVSQYTAAFSIGNVFSAYCEKNAAGIYELRRGFGPEIKGKKVVIVEDVVTTGRTLEQVISVVRQAGGDVLGVAAIVNRSKITAELLGVPIFIFLHQLELPLYPGDNCPLCQQGFPVNTEFGYGADFLRRGHEED